MTSESTNVSESEFWTRFHLEEGEIGRFTLGPLSFWIQRGSGYWQIAGLSDEDRQSPRLERSLPETAPTWPEDADTKLVMDQELGGNLELRPAMADRLLIAFPEEELIVRPRSQAVIFVSSPIWLQIWTDRGLLFERPVVRPSDTWFGADTRHGELAYGVRTPVTMTPEQQTRLPFRALSRIEIDNRADDELILRRMALPALNLGLYFDPQLPELGLWTEAVRLERTREAESTDIKVLRGPAGSTQMASPRQAQTRNFLIRALSSIIS